MIAALEAGATYTGPSGKVSVDGPSHRNIQDVRLARVNDKQGFDILATFDQVKPSREIVGAGSCDLTGKDQKSHRI